jgi:hypothetical protein
MSGNLVLITILADVYQLKIVIIFSVYFIGSFRLRVSLTFIIRDELEKIS